jgi:hypothetical protein
MIECINTTETEWVKQVRPDTKWEWKCYNGYLLARTTNCSDKDAGQIYLTYPIIWVQIRNQILYLQI